MSFEAPLRREVQYRNWPVASYREFQIVVAAVVAFVDYCFHPSLESEVRMDPIEQHIRDCCVAAVVLDCTSYSEVVVVAGRPGGRNSCSH